MIVALPHVADALTAVLLLAAIPLRRRHERAAASAGEPPATVPELPATTGSLSARDLRLALGGRPVLRGLDLEVSSGEIHALIGPNGSGKTTALRALKVTRTLQRDAGFPALTPYHQLQRPGRFSALWHLFGPLEPDDRDRRDKPAVTQRLAHVHARFPRLAERTDQRAATLSGGEQQLLGIARALMGAPELLILEDPSAGLAPPAVKGVAEACKGSRS